MSGAPVIRARERFDFTYAWQAYWTRNGWRQFVPFFVAVAAFCVFQLQSGRAPNSYYSVAVVLALVVIFGLPALAAMLWWSVALRNEARRTAEYVFDDAGMTVRDGAGMSVHESWAEISGVRDASQGFLVRGVHEPRFIRFSAFAPDDLPRLRSLFAEHTTLESR